MVYDNFYYEAGHVVIASLFPKVYYKDFVTLNETESRSFNTSYLGGMNGRPLKISQERTAMDIDALVLIFLAGLCADDINIHEGMKEDFFIDAVWMNKFQHPRYTGDIRLIGREFALLNEKGYYNGSYNDYIISAMRIVYKILSDTNMWHMVELVRNTLFNSNEKRLNDK